MQRITFRWVSSAYAKIKIKQPHLFELLSRENGHSLRPQLPTSL